MTHQCVIVPCQRSQHRELFRWLDKNAKGWWLGYKSDERATTNYLMGLIDALDIEEPWPLMEYLYTKKSERDYRTIIDRLPMFVTPEQGVLLVMFWEGALPFNEPLSTV